MLGLEMPSTGRSVEFIQGKFEVVRRQPVLISCMTGRSENPFFRIVDRTDVLVLPLRRSGSNLIHPAQPHHCKVVRCVHIAHVPREVEVFGCNFA